MGGEYNPLTAPPAKEVPLPHTPLVRVIAQIKFPPIASTEKQDFIAGFQEAIRESYPILRPEQTQTLVFSPQGAPVAGSTQKTWRFSDLDQAWRVSLAPDFVALETTAYQSRTGFFGRLDAVILALEQHVDPKVVDRIGVRYIDRIRGNEFNRIGSLVRKEVLGIASFPFASHARRTLCESLFDIPGSNRQLLARWGKVPEDETYDPSTIEPVSEPSWILDIDMFCAEQRRFAVADISKETRDYAERIYTFFRWAIEDEFLGAFGGEA